MSTPYVLIPHTPNVTALRGEVDVDHIAAWTRDTVDVRDDVISVEEPLEIRLAGCSVAVTMRTPGDDFDLALGFLYTEGIIRGGNDVASVAYCPTDGPSTSDAGDPASRGNIVNVNPTDPALVDPDRWQRNFFAASSCGICGKASIDAVRQDCPRLVSNTSISHKTLYGLNATMRRAQTTFGHTGGLHAAALFDPEGQLLVLREDVGRHNAVDKVVGDALQRNALPLRERILLVSGRTSFEIVQKALMAGIGILLSVSAPSSLAVDLARSTGMTLVGFLREERFNIYSGPERIA
jgi:FdhD protein